MVELAIIIPVLFIEPNLLNFQISMNVPSTLMGVLSLVLTPLDHILAVVELGTVSLPTDVLVKVWSIIISLKVSSIANL